MQNTLKNIPITSSLGIALFLTASQFLNLPGDPYFEITTWDNQTIKTQDCSFSIGDFNDDDQPDFLRNHTEITNLIFLQDDPEDSDGAFPIPIHIPLSSIKSISLLND